MVPRHTVGVGTVQSHASIPCHQSEHWGWRKHARQSLGACVASGDACKTRYLGLPTFRCSGGLGLGVVVPTAGVFSRAGLPVPDLDTGTQPARATRVCLVLRLGVRGLLVALAGISDGNGRFMCRLRVPPDDEP